MDRHSFYTKRMLLQYGRQLIASRRLARFEQRFKAREAQKELSSNTERNLMVERIAYEVIDTLLLTGSQNPVVAEVKERLSQTLGEELVFQYPPGETDIKIMRCDPEGKFSQVSAEDQQEIMSKLLAITRETVASTML